MVSTRNKLPKEKYLSQSPPQRFTYTPKEILGFLQYALTGAFAQQSV